MNDPHLAAALQDLAQGRLASAMLLAAHCAECGGDAPPEQPPAPYIALWIRLAEKLVATERAAWLTECAPQPGEALADFARRCRLPAALIAALNDLRPGAALVEGKALRVPACDFTAELDLARREMTVSWHDAKCATFALHLNADFAKPVGEYEVRRKRIDPVHYDPQGAATPRDYRGPFLRHVLDLSGGWSLHGLPAWDLRPIDVGVATADAAIVYAALQVGSKLKIVQPAPTPIRAEPKLAVATTREATPAPQPALASTPAAAPNRAELAAAIERLPLVVAPVRKAQESTVAISATNSARAGLGGIALDAPIVRGSRAVVGWHSCVGNTFPCQTANTAPAWLHKADAAQSWQVAAPPVDWPAIDDEDADLLDDSGDEDEYERPETDSPVFARDQGAAWPAPTGWQLANIALSLATLIAVVWQTWRENERVAAIDSLKTTQADLTKALTAARELPAAPATAAHPAGHDPHDPEFSVPAYPDRGPEDVARVNYEQPQPLRPAAPAAEPPATPKADLKMNVYVPQAPVAVGASAVYELRVTNRGTAAAANVDVCCFFSEGFEPVGADGAPPRIGSGQVQFERIPRIEPGQERVFRIAARADSEGARIFRPDVKCANPETHLYTDVTTQFVRPVQR